MRQLARILSFSFLSQARSKGMIVSTVIVCLVIAVGMCLPTVIGFFSGGEEAPGPNPSGPSEISRPGELEGRTIVVSDPEGFLFTGTEALSEMFPGYIWKLEGAGREALEERVQTGEINSALLVSGKMEAAYIYKSDINMFGDDLAPALQAYLTDRHRYELLLTYNVTEADRERFFDVPVLEYANVGMQNLVGQIQSFAFILFLYFTILGSGQMVSTSVAQEKSSRAMEILITTSRPETLMFGKVAGIGLAGLLQTVLFILTGAGFYYINQKSIVSVEMLGELLAIPASTFIYALIFFLGGYFFYAMLFAAIGSLVSRTEDLASANVPMTLFTVAGFLVAIYGQLYGFAGSLFYKICSWFPLTSPYVMLARVCGDTNIPAWEIWGSILVLYLSTLAAGVLSAKIYRVGVLIYGKRPSLKEVFSALRQA